MMWPFGKGLADASFRLRMSLNHYLTLTDETSLSERLDFKNAEDDLAQTQPASQVRRTNFCFCLGLGHLQLLSSSFMKPHLLQL